MRVKSIKPAGTADVYNMEVEDTHDFAVGNGVIVHNCYDMLRYVCMRNLVAPRLKKVVPIRGYDPLDIFTEDKGYDPYAFYRKR